MLLTVTVIVPFDDHVPGNAYVTLLTVFVDVDGDRADP
jgi:hypothetical protein